MLLKDTPILLLKYSYYIKILNNYFHNVSVLPTSDTPTHHLLMNLSPRAPKDILSLYH